MQNSKKIVARAWNLVIRHRKILFSLGFWPSFFSIFISGFWIFYQIQAFRFSTIFSDGQTHFTFELIAEIWKIVSQNTVIFSVSLVLLLVILIGYFLIPIICRGAIISLISQAAQEKEPKNGIPNSIFNFLQLFELNALKSGMSLKIFFTEFSFAIRNLGIGSITILLPVFSFFALLGILANFLLSFALPAVIIKKQNFSGSIATSTRVVLENIRQTFFLMFIIFLIELRVIFNFLIFLSLPFFFISATGFFATAFSQNLGFFLGGMIFLILAILLAYLTGILFVFSEAIWAIAFLEFSKKSEE